MPVRRVVVPAVAPLAVLAALGRRRPRVPYVAASDNPPNALGFVTNPP